MADAILVEGIVPAEPAAIFSAFLDAEAHGAMTGSAATDDGDGRFTAWGGYIQGQTLSTEAPHRIVQAWRTVDFPDDAPDSVLEIRLEAVDGGTRVTFAHANIPAGQGVNYESGWVDHYLDPMRAHFG